jgi:hypothetical protein
MILDILVLIFIILIIIIASKIYYDSDSFQLKCIISSVDGNKYCVRDRKELKLAADNLAIVTNKLKLVIKYCKENFPNQYNTKNLIKGFNPRKIVEILPTSEYVAYSENKGEKLALCLEKEKGKNHLIDINTLTFVALHELAHIASNNIGHGDEFWKNFKFLLERATEIGVYTPIDYKKKPKRYCSTTIHDNPLYDL